MTTPGGGDVFPWADAVLAAVLFAVDAESAGVVVRARAGPVRDRWLSLLSALLPQGMPFRRLPMNVTDDRLLGGLDLAATLAAARPVAERGILAEVNGGVLVIPCAERLAPLVGARVLAAHDRGEVAIERDGLALRAPSRFGFIALDEGMDDGERESEALLDRAAFHIDLTGVRMEDAAAEGLDRDAVVDARRRLPTVCVQDNAIEALTGAAVTLGIPSLRAALLAVRVARVMAALSGRDDVTEDDVVTAGRLVLAPRATRLPAAEPPGEPEELEAPSPDNEGKAEDESPHDDGPLDDRVLAAVAAAIPAGLLARLTHGRGARAKSRSMGKAGATRQSPLRGRPLGARRGDMRAGARLNIVETLRAAAPWQRVRRGEGTPTSDVQSSPPPNLARKGGGIASRGWRTISFLFGEHSVASNATGPSLLAGEALSDLPRSPSPRVRGEGWGEGRQQAMAPVFAPHPNPLPVSTGRGNPSTIAGRRGIPTSDQDRPHRVHVRRDDFRITRFKARAETTTIFVVDASGSAALHRLAEAKGAVELLLADCYARRDSVALIAFRGRAAELLLPPTRALARAKRSLAGLPGGGGTPLAAGIEAAAALGDAVRRKGQTPSIVLLTDGRANVARDPKSGRARAEEDALAAARVVRAAGLRAILIDTSPRPEAQAARLAGEMGALYLALPRADAAALSEAVKAARGP